MRKIVIYTLGKIKEPWLQLAIQEYTKRLKGAIEIQWKLYKEEKRLYNEASAIPHLISLDPQGIPLTSEQLSKKLFNLPQEIAFLIGGPEGIPPHLSSKNAWSLSNLTFTGQMSRLILIEQLYRAYEIDRNSPYHK